MIQQIDSWEETLPSFLKPKAKTLTGLRGFERQNTILKLALAHVRILATRRCLLMDFRHQKQRFNPIQEDAGSGTIKYCLSAIMMTLDTVEALMDVGQCYGSFWSTQYIAVVAISTFYVFMIQGMRKTLPAQLESYLDIDETLSRTKRCHEHLATLPPPGSQAERHQILLGHLRAKVDKSLKKMRGAVEPAAEQRELEQQSRLMSIENINNGQTDVEQQYNADLMITSGQIAGYKSPTGAVDLSFFSTMMTPNSNSDGGFSYIPDFGWENLDTIGALGQHDMNFGIL